jgi:hypothetical protein
VSTTGRRSPALWVAIAASVLCLGLPIVAGFPGRVLTVRVLLVGAVVLIALALAAPVVRRRERHLVVGAVVLLGFTAALLVRALAPTGLVLLAIAIGSLLWQQRAWARR